MISFKEFLIERYLNLFKKKKKKQNMQNKFIQCCKMLIKKMILESINKFKNINIFINRNENIKYEIEGRIQSEKEAKEIDNKLKELLQEFKMEFIDYYN